MTINRLIIFFILAMTSSAIAEIPIVEINVTAQDYDVIRPWMKAQPATRIGNGILIAEGKILTTERLVRNAKHIEILRARSGDTIIADVESTDIDSNLAVIKINDKLDGFAPINISDKVELNEKVSLFSFDESADIKEGKAAVVKIGTHHIEDSSQEKITFSLLLEGEFSGEGSPVISKGKLAGLIVNQAAGDRTAVMIPYVTIKKFLNDIKTTPYTGCACSGFDWTALVDPAKRKYLGISEKDKGVLILSTLPGTDAEKVLKPEDVLLAIDEYTIDNLGFYTDREFGRLGFSYIINGLHKAGDVVKTKIIRNKQEMTIDLKLSVLNDNDAYIPEETISEAADYIVEGGLVFRELTGKYLSHHGTRWESMINPRLVQLYHTKQYKPDKPGQHVVILSIVLPDAINIGYQNIRDQVVTHVNGKEINNVNDLFDIIKKDGCIERVSLLSYGLDIVLSKKDIPLANERIAENFRIPVMKHSRKSFISSAQ